MNKEWQIIVTTKDDEITLNINSGESTPTIVDGE
jgi:hypothetical protein